MFLSTDGLHDRLDVETFESVLNSGQRLKSRAQCMVDKAVKAGSGDDITAVMLSVF